MLLLSQNRRKYSRKRASQRSGKGAHFNVTAADRNSRGRLVDIAAHQPPRFGARFRRAVRPDRTFLAHGANFQVRHRTGKAKMLARKRRLARPIFIAFNFTFGYSRSLTEVREFPYSKLFSSFFRAHRTNDLTKKLEKVGPFECDELEKHCRVSAKCYLTTEPN